MSLLNLGIQLQNNSVNYKLIHTIYNINTFFKDMIRTNYKYLIKLYNHYFNVLTIYISITF